MSETTRLAIISFCTKYSAEFPRCTQSILECLKTQDVKGILSFDSWLSHLADWQRICAGLESVLQIEIVAENHRNDSESWSYLWVARIVNGQFNEADDKEELCRLIDANMPTESSSGDNPGGPYHHGPYFEIQGQLVIVTMNGGLDI